MAFAFIPPAALELGNATGFSFVITDDNNLGHLKLAAARDKLLAAATKDPRLAGVRIFGQKDVGQRSEEHTSELQSLMRTSYAVFCLNKTNLHNIYINLSSPNLFHI